MSSYMIQLRNVNQEEIDYKLQVHSSYVLNNFEKVKKHKNHATCDRRAILRCAACMYAWRVAQI